MKKLMPYIMLATTAIIFSNCTKDSNDEGVGLIWGYIWDGLGTTYLKSVDLNSGEETNVISLNKLGGGSENLVYNELKNEMLFTAKDSLYSINLVTQEISQISFIGDSVFGLRLDSKNEIIYGLIARNSKYQFVGINISGNNINRTITQINVPEISDIAGTALNSREGKFYFCANDTLYLFNLLENRIEKSIKSDINNIEYNSLSDELIGIGNINAKNCLIKLNSELTEIKTIEFSEEIWAYSISSTINKKTGDYIFKGNGYIMHIVNIETGMIENINAEIESGYEFQSK
ncbi:MAG: hypothetical protein JXB49_12905 [Bacteroidales bacterium]|nr:hypothetical protein [Bacteroidales bacterium]